MLRLLHRLALAIATLVVCAIVNPGQGSASLLAAAAVDVPVPATADAECGARTVAPSHHHWRDSDTDPIDDTKALELDLDEEDPLCDVPDGAAPALACLPLLRKPDRVQRGELQVDTSRFAAGTGLPRGPPSA